MTEVIAQLRPRAFVVENVKGLTRAAFSDYLEFIKLRLQHPLLAARDGETWVEHFTRLQKEHTQSHEDLRYNIVPKVVNAADYGVPQHRHRVFLVGFRSDVDAEWSFPEATHSGAALALAQQSGDYWERWNVPTAERHPIVRRAEEDGKAPWKTVREALAGMPRPGKNGTPGWMDHKNQPGAKTYPGHTGSPLDEPSKTLKAGGHGVPGGENMIRFPDGRVRYYSIREAARIQTFPDRYALHGAWGEAMRQIGNAVPVLLAEKVMGSVVEHLELDSGKRIASSVRHLRAVS